MSSTSKLPEGAKQIAKTISTSETGHKKNLANFYELLSVVTGYGVAYNPSKVSLGLAALKVLSTTAGNAANAVDVAEPVYSLAVAAREVAFAPLSMFSTRVINALKATDTTPEVDERAMSIVRKIHGPSGAVKKKELAPGEIPVKGVSTSQMSFDSRLASFERLVQFLATVPQYNPNEEELKVTTLTARSADLKAKNEAVVNAYTALTNARIARNNILYKDTTGLVDVALDVKSYAKSVYGASSPQYAQISKIDFKSMDV